MTDDPKRSQTPVPSEPGDNIVSQPPRAETPVASTSIATNMENVSPQLEARSKRSAESRRTIAFNRLKAGYIRSSNQGYLHSLTKMEIKISLDLMVAE